MKRRIEQMAFVVLALSLVAGGYDTARGAEPATAAVAPPAEWVKTEIYFGCNLPGGQQIARWAWADFMDKVLTRHFPKGLTVYEAYGQMQHADGRIEKQSTWVVVVLHPRDPSIDQVIREIADAFRKQFNKAQVVHISAPLISARFYGD
jgi:hypothetical protein